MTREEKLQQFAEQNTKGLHLDRHNLIQMVKQGAEWADQHPQWIPVEEKLPKHDVEENGLITYPSVLVCLYDGFRDKSYYDDIRGEWGDYDGEVEYWMPMPAAPTKEGGQEDAS